MANQKSSIDVAECCECGCMVRVEEAELHSFPELGLWLYYCPDCIDWDDEQANAYEQWLVEQEGGDTN